MKYYQNEDGFVFRSECIICEKFASFNPTINKCECRDLYVRINNVCVAKDAVCDNKTQVWNDKFKKCECNTGYTIKNGVCMVNFVCPPGFLLFKENCYKITRNSDTKTLSSPISSPAVQTSSASTLTTKTTTNSIPS